MINVASYCSCIWSHVWVHSKLHSSLIMVCGLLCVCTSARMNFFDMIYDFLCECIILIHMAASLYHMVSYVDVSLCACLYDSQYLQTKLQTLANLFLNVRMKCKIINQVNITVFRVKTPFKSKRKIIELVRATWKVFHYVNYGITMVLSRCN